MRKAIASIAVIAVLVSGRISAAAPENLQPPNPGVIARAVSRVAAEHARAQAPLIPARSPGQRRAPRLKPILIGAGVGAALLALPNYWYCEGSCTITMLKASALGAGIGAVAGYLISTR